MKKFLNPKIVIPVSVITALLSLVAYTVFAPETWWKPIYVRFDAEEALANNHPAPTDAGNPEIDSPGPGSNLPPAQQTQPQPGQAAPQLFMPAIQPGQGVMYRLDPKVVNLAEPGGLRYLQTSIVLEFHPTVKEYYEAKRLNGIAASQNHASETLADPFQAAIEPLRPVIDDIATTLLSSKTFNQISTIEGKQQLKQELMADINVALGYQGVVNIYFTEFVVQ